MELEQRLPVAVGVLRVDLAQRPPLLPVQMLVVQQVLVLVAQQMQVFLIAFQLVLFAPQAVGWCVAWGWVQWRHLQAGMVNLLTR